MVKFAAFALVALVAFQACSARHVLKASNSVVDSTYDAAFEVMDSTAGDLISAMYDASVDFSNAVRNVESAIAFEDFDSKMYGDPEVAAEKALADIDAEIKSDAEAFGKITDAATAKIAAIVAQASAGVQDASVTGLLSLIQEQYTKALEGILELASDFSDNAADVARDAVDARPNTYSARVMQKVRQTYQMSSKSIDRKINKASEKIEAAIAKA